MDDELLRYLTRIAFRLSRDLNDASALLKNQMPAENHRAVALDIARTIDTIMTNLVDRRIEGRADLKAEIEASLTRFGRYL